MPAPLWIAALWPVVVFLGGLLWMAGRTKSTFDMAKEDLQSFGMALDLGEERRRVTAERLDRLDLRLTATETNVGNQGRILDRIEAKLDRLIEARTERP